MAKGNKIKNEFIDDIWKDVFYTNVGTYVNIISQELGKTYQLEPLSKHLKIGGGYAFKTNQYTKLGIPIIRISDFNNEKIDIFNCVFYDEDPALSKYELNFGDIIICLTGGTISKLGIVQENLGKLYLNQRVGRFDIINEDEFEKEYVYWIAKSVSSTIKNLAWGAAIPNVSPKQIEKLEFAIPPVNVQKDIIRFLNDLKDESIEGEYFDVNIEKEILKLHSDNLNQKKLSAELTHQLDLISQLRQAFLKEAMQGKLVSNETSDGKNGADILAEIKTEKEKLIKEKKIKKQKPLAPISIGEIPFDIPENWIFCKLGNLFQIVRGSSPRPKGDIRYFPKFRTQYHWITIADFAKNSVGNILMDTSQFLTLEGSKQSRIVTPDDLLVAASGVGSVGKSSEIGITGFIYDGLMAIKNIENKTTKKYISFYLKVKELEIYSIATGANWLNINTNLLNNYILPLPPLEIQNRIVFKLEELMSYCDALETSVKESQNYNEQLLQQVLREALEVKEMVTE